MSLFSNNIIKALLKHLIGGKSNEETNEIRSHQGVSCDYCTVDNFEGDRYKCTVCDDYDLCSKCFLSSFYSKNHQLNHPVLCITNPIVDPKERENFEKFSRLNNLAKNFVGSNYDNLECDICEKELIGVRIKCESCYNYDMCYACWQKDEHLNHPLILFTNEILEQFPFENIEIISELGAGCFGKVYKAHILPKKRIIACKTVESGGNNIFAKLREFQCLQSLQREMNAHLEIRSAFICKLFGYSIDITKDRKLYIIMEYMHNGSLSSIIKKENEGEMAIPYLRKIKMMSDISCALKDIHRKNYIHADLKPDNVLVTYDFVAKISDFGIVKNKNVEEDNSIGSARYMPADFFTGKYDKSVDIYSFGLVLYQFFTGVSHEINDTTKLPILNKLDSIAVKQIKELITVCTKSEPAERLFAEIHHSLLRNWYETFMKLLEYSSFTDKYKTLTTNEKNKLFLSLNDIVIDACKKRIGIKVLFTSLGLTRNQLHAPNVDDLLTKIAILSLKSENSDNNQEE